MFQATINTMVNSNTHQVMAVPYEDTKKEKTFKLNNDKYVVKEGEIPDYEDKTSDNYIPKTYRSQSKLGLLLTHWLDKYLGVRFLQPIKWQNTISIIALHIFFAYAVVVNPWNVVKLQTAIFGECLSFL